MHSHKAHNIHGHSQLAYDQEYEKLQSRTELIFGIIRNSPEPLTARDVLNAINSKYSSTLPDMNYVRPRISELLKEGYIEESGVKAVDPVTGKNVAQFRLKAKPVTYRQAELL